MHGKWICVYNAALKIITLWSDITLFLRQRRRCALHMLLLKLHFILVGAAGWLAAGVCAPACCAAPLKNEATRPLSFSHLEMNCASALRQTVRLLFKFRWVVEHDYSRARKNCCCLQLWSWASFCCMVKIYCRVARPPERASDRVSRSIGL